MSTDRLQPLEFFEVLRRIDRSTPKAPSLGVNPHRDAQRVVVCQTAQLAFASHEVAKVTPPLGDLTPRMQTRVEVRHFGLFAPYGPLPVHITEHAHHQATLDHNPAFGDFVNLLVSRLALLYYRAWSQLNVSVGHDRPDHNGFARKLDVLCGVNPNAHVSPHVQAVRQTWPAAYVRSERSLSVLGQMVSAYFSLPIQIRAHAAGWQDIPSSHQHKHGRLGRACLGRLCLGRRFFDVQHRIAIEVGPLLPSHYPDYQHNMPKLKALQDIVRDYVEQRVIAQVTLHIQTSPAMSGALNAMRLGRTSWLHAVNRLVTQALGPIHPL